MIYSRSINFVTVVGYVEGRPIPALFISCMMELSVNRLGGFVSSVIRFGLSSIAVNPQTVPISNEVSGGWVLIVSLESE